MTNRAELREAAYAKINLALHVREKMADGYHRIETLFAFVDQGDALACRDADAIGLSVEGRFAHALGTAQDNLVLRAARAAIAHAGSAADGFAPHFTLTKNLPVASGIGGGSTDAAAALRLMAGPMGFDPRDLLAIAAPLGADVPACVISETRIGRGRGERLAMPPRDDWRHAPVLLVNPGVPLSTPHVFSGWDGDDRGALQGHSVSEMALKGRNDLEASAIALCPAIAQVLAALQREEPLLARMSGSGATCFAIYTSEADRDAAMAHICAKQPDWWTLAGRLR